jgi:hypothetical protein
MTPIEINLMRRVAAQVSELLILNPRLRKYRQLKYNPGPCTPRQRLILKPRGSFRDTRGGRVAPNCDGPVACKNY